VGSPSKYNTHLWGIGRAVTCGCFDYSPPPYQMESENYRDVHLLKEARSQGVINRKFSYRVIYTKTGETADNQATRVVSG